MQNWGDRGRVWKALKKHTICSAYTWDGWKLIKYVTLLGCNEFRLTNQVSDVQYMFMEVQYRKALKVFQKITGIKLVKKYSNAIPFCFMDLHYSTTGYSAWDVNNYLWIVWTSGECYLFLKTVTDFYLVIKCSAPKFVHLKSDNLVFKFWVTVFKSPKFCLL